ncbi:MAG TPA: MarR family transcriptional regulator [Phycisphaerales bacterium]|nr:MarR family transcriptional regulator [Phycisphaerales bacterium]
MDDAPSTPARPSLSSPSGPEASSLAHELGKKHAFDLAEQEAYLNLVRTTSTLSVELERFLRDHDLSGATYNALRILRGATMGEDAPGKRPCSEIGEQMVAQVPDVTRVVDRIEKMGLAQRIRCQADRRVVYVKITRKGLDLLARLDEPILGMHRAQLGHMSPRELADLNRLLVKARRPAAARTPSER